MFHVEQRRRDEIPRTRDEPEEYALDEPEVGVHALPYGQCVPDWDVPMKVLDFAGVLAMITDPETRERLEALHAEGKLTGNVYRGPGTKDDVLKRITLYLEDV